MLQANKLYISMDPNRQINWRVITAIIVGVLLFTAVIVVIQSQSQRAISLPTLVESQDYPTSTTARSETNSTLPTTEKTDPPGEEGTTATVSTLVPLKDLGMVGTFKPWSKVEIILLGPESDGLDTEANPFEKLVEVVFTGPDGRTYTVPAFFDGDGAGGMVGNIWKVRFSPDKPGDWRFETSSQEFELNSYIGDFEVLASTECQDTTGELQDLNCYGRLEYTKGHYLQFQNGTYWIKAGIDDPENFIGNALGDWDAKKSAIDYLSSKGVNSVYIITNNIDGDRNDTWPWVGDSPAQAKANSRKFNNAKLQKWEDFFSYVQSKGIVLHIVLNDDSAWNDYDHDLYFREMVARFGHHPGIIWNIGEEANEIYSNDEQLALARKLQQIDPFNHPVTVHRKSPWPFLGETDFDLTSIQTGDGANDFTNQRLPNYNEVVREHRRQSNAICHAIPIMIDELPRVTSVNDQIRTKMRTQVLYPIFLGGGNFELHYHDAYGQGGSVTMQDLEPMLVDMRLAREFVEDLPFFEMEPCNDLLSGRNNLCFGKAGEVYAIYLPGGGSENVNLSQTTGVMDASWFNPRTGDIDPAGSVEGNGIRTFTAPDNNDWVLQLIKPQVQGNSDDRGAGLDLVSLSDSDGQFKMYLPWTLQCGG